MREVGTIGLDKSQVFQLTTISCCKAKDHGKKKHDNVPGVPRYKQEPFHPYWSIIEEWCEGRSTDEWVTRVGDPKWMSGRCPLLSGQLRNLRRLRFLSCPQVWISIAAKSPAVPYKQILMWLLCERRKIHWKTTTRQRKSLRETCGAVSSILM